MNPDDLTPKQQAEADFNQSIKNALDDIVAAFNTAAATEQRLAACEEAMKLALIATCGDCATADRILEQALAHDPSQSDVSEKEKEQ